MTNKEKLFDFLNIKSRYRSSTTVEYKGNKHTLIAWQNAELNTEGYMDSWDEYEIIPILSELECLEILNELIEKRDFEIIKNKLFLEKMKHEFKNAEEVQKALMSNELFNRAIDESNHEKNNHFKNETL